MLESAFASVPHWGGSFGNLELPGVYTGLEHIFNASLLKEVSVVTAHAESQALKPINPTTT